MEYFQKIQICHRNIKAANILVQKDLNIKLIDFALSKQLSLGQPVKGYCGSDAYMTDDMKSGNEYDAYKSDVWACFVILFFMLTGKHPSDGRLTLA